MPGSSTDFHGELIETHLDAMFRAAFRLTRNRSDAQDLVQETCARACRRIKELEDSSHVKAWLLQVLYNVFIDGARRCRRSPIVRSRDGQMMEAPCPNPNPEEAAHNSQRELDLHLAWSKLDRNQRTLLALRAEGYSLVEIGEIMRLRPDALYSRLYRARQSLLHNLADAKPAETDEQAEFAK